MSRQPDHASLIVNVCHICSSKRANIRLLPCGHVFHDRCLFPWPCKYCPALECNELIVNFECMKIEPFIYSGIKFECPNMMHVFGINRRGRWTEEEYEYALALIEAFNAGLVHLPESLKLGSFLCKMLQCCAARLSSKIRKGKKVYHSKRIPEGAAVDAFEIAHYRSVQQKLSDAEEEFLNKIAASFDPEEASVLSYHIQHSWRKGFLASTHFDLSKHKLTPSPLSTSSRIPVDSKGFFIENKLFACLRSVAHRFTSWPLELSAHLLLEEITVEHPAGVALAINLQNHDVIHVSSSFQSVVSQFLGKDSFLALNDLEFIFKNHNDLIQALTKYPANKANKTKSDGNYQQFQKKVELVLVDDDKCTCLIDILFVGSISLSTLRLKRCSLRPCQENNDGSGIGDFEDEEEDRSLSDTFVDIGADTAPSGIEGQYSNGRQSSVNSVSSAGAGGKKSQGGDIGKRNYEGSNLSRGDDNVKRSPFPSSSSNYSSSSLSLQKACGSFLLTSDKHQVPQQIGSNLPHLVAIGQESNFSDNFNSILVEGGRELMAGIEAEEILSRNPIVNIVYSGGTGAARGSGSKHKPAPYLSSTASDKAPTLLSATTTVDPPSYSNIPDIPRTGPNVPISFESILQSFLRVIPFHLVEIWVPVQLEDGSTVLLYGASGALDKELHGWSQYSRNFSFNPDVGLPGRVATARTAESRTDVAKLPMPTFLRAEMAGELGIHAACGLPFFTGNKCDAVVVFYSRHIFEPTPSLIEYMGRICESLNIRAQIRILKPHGA